MGSKCGMKCFSFEMAPHRMSVHNINNHDKLGTTLRRLDVIAIHMYVVWARHV